MNRLNNRNYLNKIRKNLRNHSTSAEATLWKILQKRKVANLKFRRQHSIGNYVLDFYCPEIKLGIELDAEFHSGPAIEQKDRDRNSYFENLSIEILHFENRWVFEYPQDIIEAIEEVNNRRKRTTLLVNSEY